MSSGLLRRLVCQKFTDVSEVLEAFITDNSHLHNRRRETLNIVSTSTPEVATVIKN
jgi:hypothetical protein